MHGKRQNEITPCERARKAFNQKNPTMLIFLGKNELGQSDKAEQNHSGEVTLRARLSDVSDESDR